MTIGEVIKFLKGVQPFQELDEETLQNLASGIILEFHPKGSIILQQDGPASDCLWIIRKGAVRVFVRSESGEEVDIDSRREGEAFGFLSLMSGDKSRANVVALADTTTYLVSRETMFRLLDTHPAFAEYFLLSIFNKYIDKSYKEMRKKSLLCSGGNNLLFTTPLSELITREVVTASQDISIRDAAGIMSRSRISCLVLLDSSGIPAGIVTDRDLRDKVTAKDRRVEDPVREIMSALLIRADAQEYGFEALLKMMRYNIHHLLVIDNGRLRGVVTNHDLMMLQGTSPISIVREIESQKTIEGLAPAAKKLNRIIELLTREGAKASNIVRIITEINDRLLKKILDITEEKLGPPPVSYCWIVYGSEGRKEQTIKTDQDNAIIYEDPRNKDEEDKANSYFTNFAVRMNEALMECGFPACPANYMASNPKWRQPLRTWKEYFSKWINHPTPEAILYSLIFFDFRPIGGNITLAQELRSYLGNIIKDQNIFLALMAGNITKNRPPLGFFGSFSVERKGEHKNALNIKQNAIGLIVDAVRFFALENGVSSTSTLERIRDLKDRHHLVNEFGDELEQNFEFLMLLRLRHQLEQIHDGAEPDNFINPEALNHMERNTLKESFKFVSRIQDYINEGYRAGVA